VTQFYDVKINFSLSI